MAAPLYATDLTDIDLAEATTGYAAYGGGASGLGAGADFAMQGVNCIDKQITSAEKGILYDNGAGITMGAGDHTWVWHYTATAGVTDTLANRGVVINIGSGTGAFVKYHVEGSDTFGAGGRVARCYPVDQTVQSANLGAVPYRTLVGSPSGVLQFFGSGLSTVAAVKSANMGLDAQRYGKGGFITAGDVAAPANFADFAAESSAIANRWGILTDLGGLLELQGTFAVGQDSAGVATQAYFVDADKNLSIADTVHSATDFTQFVFDHALTEAYWTNIGINALGTNNRGLIDVITGKLIINGGSLTGFGTTSLSPTSSANGHTWRASDTITLNGAPLTGGAVEKSTGAVTALVENDLDIIETHFVGANDIHAVEMPDPVTVDVTKNWKSTFDPATYAAVNGATGSEALKCSVGAGVTLTINVVAGATTPTVNNTGAGTVSIISGAVDLTITVQDGDTLALLQNVQTSIHLKDAPFTPLMNEDTTVLGVATESYTGSLPVDVVWKCRKSETTDDPRYYGKSGVTTIDSNGLNLTVLLKVNPFI